MVGQRIVVVDSVRQLVDLQFIFDFNYIENINIIFEGTPEKLSISLHHLTTSRNNETLISQEPMTHSAFLINNNFKSRIKHFWLPNTGKIKSFNKNLSILTNCAETQNHAGNVMQKNIHITPHFRLFSLLYSLFNNSLSPF